MQASLECPHCNADAGSLQHAAWMDCPAIQTWRRDYDLPDRVWQAAQQHPEWSSWRHTLVPDSRKLLPPPALQFSTQWSAQAFGGLLEGDVFGDGSLSSIVRGDPLLRLAGWGLAQVNPAGNYGLCALALTSTMEKDHIKDTIQGFSDSTHKLTQLYAPKKS